MTRRHWVRWLERTWIAPLIGLSGLFAIGVMLAAFFDLILRWRTP